MFNNPERTIGSMLEVKFCARSGIANCNKIDGNKLVNQIETLGNTYPDISVDIGELRDEANKLYSFEIDKVMEFSQFKNIMMALDSEANIKFLACVIKGEIDSDISTNDAIAICYNKYLDSIEKFNELIIKLAKLSDSEQSKVYCPFICTKFILRIPFSDTTEDIMIISKFIGDMETEDKI